ncbi:MAG: fasciclin domain-containing protein [Gammaproteobacteria bacterium]
MTFNVAALAGGQSDAKMQSDDIVDVAVSAGTFETLVAAVQAAELVNALKGEGPYTVFAPTDDAFAALPEGTVENLLKPENQAQLQAVLLYHVVPGKVMKRDLQGTVTAETLEGATVEIVKNKGWTEAQRNVTVNGANVVAADVKASNGVIHVIDAVILPPQSMAAN